MRIDNLLPTRLLTKDDDNKVTILLIGDVMLGRTVMTHSLDKVGDPRYPFFKVAETLRKADLVFINLENPVIQNCPRHSEGFKFCADPKMVEGLTYAGVDVVNLANNHSRNYGQDGLNQTVDYLNKAGMQVTGLNALAIRQFNNVKFGFLGFDFVTNQAKNSDYELVKSSDSKVDVLIVGVHWGSEYQPKANPSQKSWARKLVENGADVVIGHHPHWVQELEYPIYYSLGNFVFDQMWSEETRKGLAVRLTFEGKKLIKEDLLPCYMSSWAQPEFIERN